MSTKTKQQYSQVTLNGLIVLSFKVDKNGHFNERELRSMFRNRINGYNEEFEFRVIDGETPIIMIEEK